MATHWPDQTLVTQRELKTVKGARKLILTGKLVGSPTPRATNLKRDRERSVWYDYSEGGSNNIELARSNKMLDTIIIQQMKNKGLQIMWFGCIKTLTKYIKLQLEKKYPNVRN